MSGSVEAVPLGAARKRSVGRSAGRGQRKPGREARSSVSRAAALRPPALRRRRAWRQSRLAGKWRRNGLKWFNSRREMVWPWQTWTPNIWVRGRRERRPKNYRRR